VWSKAPARSTASVLRAKVFTQCPWPFKVLTSFPSAASHTFMLQSLLLLYMSPSPPQRTHVTTMVWLDIENKQRRLLASQTRIVWSLLPLTKRRLGRALCAGSQA